MVERLFQDLRSVAALNVRVLAVRLMLTLLLMCKSNQISTHNHEENPSYIVLGRFSLYVESLRR
jgi:hypothetical protein